MGMAWDVGTFTKAADLPTCLSFATAAFQNYGLPTWGFLPKLSPVG
jgi:hypothetical protein